MFATFTTSFLYRYTEERAVSRIYSLPLPSTRAIRPEFEEDGNLIWEHAMQNLQLLEKVLANCIVKLDCECMKILLLFHSSGLPTLAHITNHLAISSQQEQATAIITLG